MRAFADRMLIALGGVDDPGNGPETGDDIAKGVKLALMIERVYARVDASEAEAPRRAAEAISDRVVLKSRAEWGEGQLKEKLSVPFVTLSEDAPAQGPDNRSQAPQDVSPTDARPDPPKAEPTSRAPDDAANNGLRLILQGLLPENEIEALINSTDDTS
ncbi:MAG: hypothetical protein QM667_12350 [Asticcacaulis sp.]